MNTGIFNSNRGEIKEHIANYQFGVREEEVRTASGIVIPNRRAIIRTDNDTVVGEVGSNYKVLTHSEALDPLLDRLTKKKVKTFKRVALVDNGSRMYANIYFPDQELNLPTADRSSKDTCWPGIGIVNSLDGTLKYSLEATIYRLACTNGMRIPTKIASFKTTHSKNKSFDDLIDEILSKVSDADRFIVLNKWASEQIKPENMEKLAEKIIKHKKNTFPARYLPLVKEEIEKEGKNGLTTVWGLYNAFNSVLEHNLIRGKGKLERARMLDENLFKVFDDTFNKKESVKK